MKRGTPSVREVIVAKTLECLNSFPDSMRREAFENFEGILCDSSLIEDYDISIVEREDALSNSVLSALTLPISYYDRYFQALGDRIAIETDMARKFAGVSPETIAKIGEQLGNLESFTLCVLSTKYRGEFAEEFILKHLQIRSGLEKYVGVRFNGIREPLPQGQYESLLSGLSNVVSTLDSYQIDSDYYLSDNYVPAVEEDAIALNQWCLVRFGKDAGQTIVQRKISKETLYNEAKSDPALEKMPVFQKKRACSDLIKVWNEVIRYRELATPELAALKTRIESILSEAQQYYLSAIRPNESAMWIEKQSAEHQRRANSAFEGGTKQPPADQGKSNPQKKVSSEPAPPVAKHDGTTSKDTNGFSNWFLIVGLLGATCLGVVLLITKRGR